MIEASHNQGVLESRSLAHHPIVHKVETKYPGDQITLKIVVNVRRSQQVISLADYQCYKKDKMEPWMLMRHNICRTELDKNCWAGTLSIGRSSLLQTRRSSISIVWMVSIDIGMNSDDSPSGFIKGSKRKRYWWFGVQFDTRARLVWILWQVTWTHSTAVMCWMKDLYPLTMNK